MLAFYLLISAAPDGVFVPPPPPNPTPMERSAPQNRADWATEGQRQMSNPANLTVPHAAQFDPNAAFLTSSSMCTIVSGQPLPDCAKAPSDGSSSHIVLNEEIFTNSVAGEDATCQTIETVRTDANGKPQRIFASYCGDDIMRNDYREVTLPTGSNTPLRPTQRNFGPTNISAVP